MKLLSWNIQWGRGADGRVDLARIAEHAQRLGDLDVLCLQEVACGYPELPGSAGEDQFTELSRHLHGYVPVYGVATDTPAPDGRRRAFGNLLLSRLPVRQVFRHLLPWPAESGVESMQRVALEATLQAPFGPLRVTTTHLEYYSALQRRAQVERLRELQREAVAQARCERPGARARGPFEHLPRGAASLLCGDFNFRPGADERRRLLNAFDDGTPGYVDAWTLAHPGVAHAPTVGLHDRVQWPEPFACDFAFVSADLAERVVDVRVDASSDASDHQPVLVELRD